VHRTLITIFALTTMAWNYGSQAQEINRSLNDRVQIAGGAWFLDMDRKLRVEDRDTGRSVSIDFDDLGLDDSDEAALLGALVRLSRRWRLDVSAASVDNSDTLAINPIVIGGRTLVPGASAGLKFSTDLVIARVGFAFVANEKGEFGVSLGASYIDAEARADASVGGAAVGDVRESVDGVIPTLGLFGTVALSEKWSITGRVSGIAISELGDIEDGNWLDASASVVYRPFENIGFGLGYSFLDADVEGDFSSGGDEFRGKVEFDYNGPLAFIEIGFGSVR